MAVGLACTTHVHTHTHIHTHTHSHKRTYHMHALTDFINNFKKLDMCQSQARKSINRKLSPGDTFLCPTRQVFLGQNV